MPSTRERRGPNGQGFPPAIALCPSTHGSGRCRSNICPAVTACGSSEPCRPHGRGSQPAPESLARPPTSRTPTVRGRRPGVPPLHTDNLGETKGQRRVATDRHPRRRPATATSTTEARREEIRTEPARASTFSPHGCRRQQIWDGDGSKGTRPLPWSAPAEAQGAASTAPGSLHVEPEQALCRRLPCITPRRSSSAPPSPPPDRHGRGRAARRRGHSGEGPRPRARQGERRLHADAGAPRRHARRQARRSHRQRTARSALTVSGRRGGPPAPRGLCLAMPSGGGEGMGHGLPAARGSGSRAR